MPDEGASLWQAILKDVAATTANVKALPPKNLVVFGAERAGKSALLHRLQGKKQSVDDSLKGTGLEFSYLDIKEEETEDVISRLGVFTLDGNADFRSLLEYIITPANVASTVALVVLDMSKPWTLGRSLERWLQILADHLATLGATVVDELKAKAVSKYLAYTEAPIKAEGDKTSGGDGAAAAPSEEPVAVARSTEGGASAAGENGEGGAAAGGEPVAHELEDGVLTRNLGIPVIVVCSKCDATAALEKDRDFRQEHFDFIQMHLRKICLHYGATLVYHGKDGRTTALVRASIMGHAYGQALPRASISERDSVFIPSGWDSPRKISMLYDSFRTFHPEDALEARILPGPAAKPHLQESADVEEEQEFLKRVQGLLGTPGREDSRASSVSFANKTSFSVSNGVSTSSTPVRTAAAEVVKEKSLSGPTPLKEEGAKGGNSSQVLSKFFSTLLKSES